ncbi:MAG: undecaprenyldiphospho-muramoylpentapeptide beta-N-acetylglucosaminyltransferase, partial [Thermodesulfobacteriota bacterium]|nr:undecaprenyldiphospho-muramoylpentapeptide beta-N-acetylglucosaminyltransferase [Thermodesulfobacteriota bacterium]
MNNFSVNIIIAGGKTGGHLFPGIAIAQALIRKEKNARILFVGTGEEFEVSTLERYGFMHTRISSAGIKGKSIKGKLFSLVQIPVSVIQSIKIIKKFRPGAVLGVGGYSSGPVLLAARFLGVMTAIHEQNTVPGITNRILSGFVHVIFTSFKNTKGFASKKNMFYTGNPIRRMPELMAQASQEPDVSGKDKFTILVTGGSQGASSINRAFTGALKLMDNPEDFKIIHQTGKLDEKKVVEEYEKMGLTSFSDLSLGMPAVKAFFHDIPSLQAMADLIISRAGAGTISEITAKGKPCILVPYPYAADDHQRYNAKSLADDGAAFMIPDRDLSPELLMEKILFCKNNPQKLSLMAGAAKRLSMPMAD